MTTPKHARLTALNIACLLTLVLAATACTSDKSTSSPTGGTSSSEPGSSSVGSSPGDSSSAPVSSSPAPPAKTKVRVKTLNEDGATYGIGMPVIVFFNRKIKTADNFAKVTKVTAAKNPIEGAWYFQRSSYYKGFPIEGHWRPKAYWPADTKIHMDLPVKNVSGGGNFVFANNLTLDFYIGDDHRGVVDNSTHRLTITDDGKEWGSFPVSLGASNTRTASGIKVIMEKGVSICMSGPGYSECGIKWTQRLTYGGEYLHSAPWNCTGGAGCTGPSNNINNGINSSNGCTNLQPADAERLYDLLQVGDPIEYPNADGGRMTLGEGYGDWNVPWTVWRQGGLYAVG